MALQVINPGQGASAQLQPFQMRLPQGPTLSAGNPVVDKEMGNLMAAVGAYADRQKKMRDNEDLVAAVTDLQKSSVDFQTEWKLSHFGVDARDAGSVFSQQVDATAKDIIENRFKGRPGLQAAFREKAMQISLQGFTHGSAYDSQQDLAYRKQQLDGMNANYQGILATGTPAQIDAARQDIVTSMELLFPGMDHTKAISDLDKTTYMGMIQRKITDGDPAGAMAYLQAGRASKTLSAGEIDQAKRLVEGSILKQGEALLNSGDIQGLRRLVDQYDGMMEMPPYASDGSRPYSDLRLNEANNNPGNINGKGGVGKGYAYYPTTLEGFKALDQLIQTSYRNMTPLELAKKYAPENDPRGKNNPAAYAQKIASDLGIGQNDKIDVADPAVRNKLMRSIAQMEGPTNRFNMDEIDYVTGAKDMPAGYKSKNLRDESRYPNGLPASEDVSGSIAKLATEYTGKIKYQMGGKNPASGKMDCSGWVGYCLEKSGIKGYRWKNAEDQTVIAMEKGRTMTVDELLANPKEGVVIGLDQGPKDHDRGRTLGIDHVSVTYRDPKTGEVMVTESSGQGVHSTPLRAWLQDHISKGHKVFAGDIGGDSYNASRGGKEGLSAEARTKLTTMLDTAEGTEFAKGLAKGVMDGTIKQSEAIAQINAMTNPKAQAKARAQFGHEMQMKSYMEQELTRQATESASTFIMGIQTDFEQDPAAGQQKLWEEMQKAETAANTGGRAEKEYYRLLKTAYTSLGTGLSSSTNPADYNRLAERIANADITDRKQLYQAQEFVAMPKKDKAALETMLTKAQKVDNAALKSIFTEIFGAPDDPMLDKEDKKNRQALWKTVQQDVYNAVKESNTAQDTEWMRAFVKKYAVPSVRPGLMDSNRTYGEFAAEDKNRDVFPEMTQEQKVYTTKVFAEHPEIAEQCLKEARVWKDNNDSWADESRVAEMVFWRSQQDAASRVSSTGKPIPPARPEKLRGREATWELSPIFRCWGWTWMDGKTEKFEPYIFKVAR